MFTGIITDRGTLRAVTRNQSRAEKHSGEQSPPQQSPSEESKWGDTRMRVQCHYDVKTIEIGASIAISGACMTVVDKGEDWFDFDVSDESLSKTTMGDWNIGQVLNLERALSAKDELGGHLVTGHVDGVGTLISKTPAAGSLTLRFAPPRELMHMIAPKGSITIDGVSLTVNDVGTDYFEVNIIPHTAEVTTLGDLFPSGKVNLEIDLIARYVSRYLAHMKV